MSEGHPFDRAQDRLSDSRPFGKPFDKLRTGARASPLCTPLIIMNERDV